MKFLRSLLGKSSAPKTLTPAQPLAAKSTAEDVSNTVPERVEAVTEPSVVTTETTTPEPSVAPSDAQQDTTAILQGLAEKLKEPKSPNIWDLDADEETASATPTPTRAPARARRNKTRLIGFDTSEAGVVDMFADQSSEEQDTALAPDAVTFPVGWALVIEGPGRGHAFPLTAGMSSIGRGADQAVRLDFGDTAISRQSHAAIVYDVATRAFLLGQGGKSNIVRLNGSPVIANEPLSDGDDIKIGETVLRLKTLCGPDFDWSDTDGGEEIDDVAIA